MLTPHEHAETLTAGVGLSILSLYHFFQNNPDYLTDELAQELRHYARHCEVIASARRPKRRGGVNLLEIMLAAWLTAHWHARFPDLDLDRQDWLEAPAGQFATKQFFDLWVIGSRQ